MSKRNLRLVNGGLAVVVVGVLLGCGGDRATPRAGSTEEQFCGDWEAEPLSGVGDVEHTARRLEFAYMEGHAGFWGGPGLLATYREEAVPVRGAPPTPSTVWESTSGLTVNGMTATGDSSRMTDRSMWIFRLDSEQPGVMYVTWTRKDGTKPLDEEPFRKKP